MIDDVIPVLLVGPILSSSPVVYTCSCLCLAPPLPRQFSYCHKTLQIIMVCNNYFVTDLHGYATLIPLHFLVILVFQVLFFLLDSFQLLLVVLQRPHLSTQLVVAFSKVLVVATGYLMECVECAQAGNTLSLVLIEVFLRRRDHPFNLQKDH